MAVVIPLALLIFPAIFGLLTPPCDARSSLLPEYRLNADNSLIEGRYRLTMQPDCNLVLYDLQTKIWETNTTGEGLNCYLTLEKNGNLVLSSDANVLWESKTNKGSGNYVCILQPDRNVVIYNNPIWSTGTYTRADKMDGAKNGTTTNFGGEPNGRKISMVTEVDE